MTLTFSFDCQIRLFQSNINAWISEACMLANLLAKWSNLIVYFESIDWCFCCFLRSLSDPLLIQRRQFVSDWVQILFHFLSSFPVWICCLKSVIQLHSWNNVFLERKSKKGITQPCIDCSCQLIVVVNRNWIVSLCYNSISLKYLCRYISSRMAMTRVCICSFKLCHPLYYYLLPQRFLSLHHIFHLSRKWKEFVSTKQEWDLECHLLLYIRTRVCIPMWLNGSRAAQFIEKHPTLKNVGLGIDSHKRSSIRDIPLLACQSRKRIEPSIIFSMSPVFRSLSCCHLYSSPFLTETHFLFQFLSI